MKSFLSKSFWRKSLCLLSFAILTLQLGCETGGGILIKEQALSLNEIRESIAAIAGKPREISQNQREYYSQYFPRNPGKANFDPTQATERMYAHFWILGERRPYDVRVQVMSERKGTDGYFLYGEDEGLTKKVGNELREQLLNQSRDERNVIDNFRPF
jgi:hypothetical protein